MRSKPLVLLIPGSFHPAEIVWPPIQKLLEERGFKTSTIELLSNNHLPETHADITVKEATAIHDHIERLLEIGDDVLVVMHSYGGVPTTNAMKGLSRKERIEAGKMTGVVGLIYMCAFMLYENARLLEDILLAKEGFLGTLRFTEHDDGWQDRPNALEAFYQDLPSSQAEALTAKLVRRDAGIANAKVMWPAYKYIPTTYVHTEKDQAIVIDCQEYMAQKVRDMGVQIDTVRWNTGHSPFANDPMMVADLVVEEARKRAI